MGVGSFLVTEMQLQRHSPNLAETVIGTISGSCGNGSFSKSGTVTVPEGMYVSRIVHDGAAAASCTGNTLGATSYIYFKDGTSYLVGSDSMASRCHFKNPTDFRPGNKWDAATVFNIDYVYGSVRGSSYPDNNPNPSAYAQIQVWGMSIPWQNE